MTDRKVLVVWCEDFEEAYAYFELGQERKAYAYQSKIEDEMCDDDWDVEVVVKEMWFSEIAEDFE